VAERDPMAGVRIEEYGVPDSEDALALERACPQGSGLRLGFRRTSFHRRAESFAEFRILVARFEGRLVGTQAVAIKDIALAGRRTRGAFLFDLRVHPDFRRRRGIGRHLAREARDWGLARAELAYLYTMAENRAVARIAGALGAAPVGGYAYLVVPTALLKRSRRVVRRAHFVDAEGRFRRANQGFDLDTRPSATIPGPGYRGSWLVGRDEEDGAGCSAWDNRDILAEVVEALPRGLSLLGHLQHALPWVRHLGLPPLPRLGEQIRSWYLFDFFAANAGSTFDLLCGVGTDAREANIDYLYVVHATGDACVAAAQRRFPTSLAPIVPYRLLARDRQGPAPPFPRLHVDIRDV
jgi:ribosomal protein S18 acetylase RimI-like enzyme